MLKDQRDLLEELNSQGVEYLVIGGHAVSAHGEPRMTKDLDVWVRSTPENAVAVFRALVRFGAPMQGMTPDDFSGQTNAMFQIGVIPHRIDILQRITAVEFDSAWDRRVEGLVDGRVPVFFIGLEDLIRNKRAAGRPRDLGDVDELLKVPRDE